MFINSVVGQGRQKEASVKTLRSVLSAFPFSGETQRRALRRHQSKLNSPSEDRPPSAFNVTRLCPCYIHPNFVRNELLQYKFVMNFFYNILINSHFLVIYLYCKRSLSAKFHNSKSTGSTFYSGFYYIIHNLRAITPLLLSR